MTAIDYTKDAIEFDKAAVMRAVLHKLGPMSPGNSAFTPDNLRDSLGDRGFYILRPDMARAFIENHKARIWKAEVCDCDTRTMCACADLADLATELGWERGAAILDLWYLSKTLGMPHASRLAGYHSAMAMLVQNEKGDGVDQWIIQPKTLRDGGSVTPTKWQTPDEEVRAWVFAVGSV